MKKFKESSPSWEFVSDTVMGGESTGSVTAAFIDKRMAHRLTGIVSLVKNGGFVQMACDVNGNEDVLDATDWAGVELDVLGNWETYEVRLRTRQLQKPWQSFRVKFAASARWKTVRIRFGDFSAHRHELAFDAAQLRRSLPSTRRMPNFKITTEEFWKWFSKLRRPVSLTTAPIWETMPS